MLIAVGDMKSMGRMSKYTTRISIAVLTFILGVSAVMAWLYVREDQKVEVQLPNANWERIFFTAIDRTTTQGKLDELRKTKLRRGDIEVRVWRGFGLGNLEGVILKRTNDDWKAFHVKADDPSEPRQVDVNELHPKSGWGPFWNKLTEKGLLTLRDPSEVGCEDVGIDGNGYVVEVNQDKVYRTYRMREDGECPGTRQMEEMDDLIGEEFDSGQEQCRTSEWFACAALRKAGRSEKQ